MNYAATSHLHPCLQVVCCWLLGVHLKPVRFHKRHTIITNSIAPAPACPGENPLRDTIIDTWRPSHHPLLGRCLKNAYLYNHTNHWIMEAFQTIRRNITNGIAPSQALPCWGRTSRGETSPWAPSSPAIKRTAAGTSSSPVSYVKRRHFERQKYLHLGSFLESAPG